jgi:hypothetical protein
MSAMRERAAHRGRPRRRKSPATQTPGDDAPRTDALPLEDLAFDPDSMPPPPSARGPHPLDEEHEDSSVGHDVLPAAPEPRSEPNGAVEDHSTTPTAPVPEPRDAGSPESQVPESLAHEDVDEPKDEPKDEHKDVDKDVDKEGDEDKDDEPAPHRPAAATVRKSARRSVPSWDDVMFGAKPRD